MQNVHKIKVSKIAIYLNLWDIFKKNRFIVECNKELWTILGMDFKKHLLLTQKYPQFSKKLSASTACMLATFSMSEVLIIIVIGIVVILII